MKKSFMSVSMLVVSITMLALFVCSSAVSAQNGKKFVYNRGENVETVYTLDESGKYLTPKVKHETVQSEDQSSKTTYTWEAAAGLWQPSYRLITQRNGNNNTLTFAVWDNKTKAFSQNQQKAVYSNGLDGELLSYVSYKWDNSTEEWDVDMHLLFENYLAHNVGSVK